MFFSDKLIMDNYIDVVVEVLSNKDVIATENYIEDNESHFDIFIDHIYITNYEKILSLNDTKIVFLAKNKKITLIGNKLSLIKMLDDDLLIQGNLSKVEME